MLIWTVNNWLIPDILLLKSQILHLSLLFCLKVVHAETVFRAEPLNTLLIDLVYSLLLCVYSDD